jgi:hypothetical protein
MFVYYYLMGIISYHWHRHYWGSVLVATYHHVLLDLCHAHLRLRNKLSWHTIHVEVRIEGSSVDLSRGLSVHDLVSREVPYLVHRDHWINLRIILVPSHLANEFLNSLLSISWILVDLVDECLPHLRICLHDLLHYKGDLMERECLTVWTLLNSLDHDARLIGLLVLLVYLLLELVLRVLIIVVGRIRHSLDIVHLGLGLHLGMIEVFAPFLDCEEDLQTLVTKFHFLLAVWVVIKHVLFGLLGSVLLKE